MAISKRLLKDKDGKTFIPMNVEGNIGEANFITTPKLLIMVVTAVFIVYVTYSFSKNIGVGSFITLLVCYYIATFVIRYAVLEEKKYFKMFIEYLKHRISDPYNGWGVASIENTPRGAVLIYEDAKTGVVARLDRDIIVGKKSDFRETHYDSVSEYVRALSINKLSCVEMNIMKPSSNDSRLKEMDKLCNVEDNKNLKTLEELLVGHIKKTTTRTMSEYEYILVYTKDIVSANKIIDKAEDCLSELLNGGYASYEILGCEGLRDLNELAKETSGSDYFNINEAMLKAYNSDNRVNNCMNIIGIGWSDGKFHKISDSDRNVLDRYTSDEFEGTYSNGGKTLREALVQYKEKSKNKELNVTSKIVDVFESEIHEEIEENTDKGSNNEYIDF